MNNHVVEAVKEKIIDNDYFKDIISQSIIFRSVEKIIKSSDVPAYRSQVCTYTVSLLSNLSGKNFKFDGQNYSYPDTKIVYWAGGNPFHHHQDLNTFNKAWQKPDTIIVNEPR